MRLGQVVLCVFIVPGAVACARAAADTPSPTAAAATSAGSPAPDSTAVSVVYPHARVRMQLPERPGTWYVGEAGPMTSPEGRVQCLVWAVAPPTPSGLRFPPIYSFQEMARAQVSERYPGDVPGRTRHVYRAGADTTGERWLEVPEAVRRATAQGC